MTAPIFLPTHAATLLGYIVNVDPRFHLPDEATAAARARAWQSILADVDPRWAMDYVRRFYSKPSQDRISPAGIRGAWMGEQRRTAERTRDRLQPSSVPPVGVKEYLRAVVTAVAAGRPADSVPVPQGRTITPELETASRKCRHARGVNACACDHTICRDGWLDEEQVVTSAHGLEYPAVVPCPYCRDAALMAAEYATPVRGGRR